MISIEPTTYTVTGLPEDDPDAHTWALRIEWRGPDSWAVCYMSRCLNHKNGWDWEPSPSGRTDKFIREHRFPLEEAKARALLAYPKLVINGLCVRDGKLVPTDMTPEPIGGVRDA